MQNDNRNPAPRRAPVNHPVRRPARKRRYSSCFSAAAYALFIIGAALIISTLAIIWVNDMFAFVKDENEVIFNVPEDTMLAELSQDLGEEGVVSYPGLFKFFVRISKKDEVIEKGEYVLNSDMDYQTVIRTLRAISSREETVMITIPEGFTTVQIAELLAEKKVCTVGQFNTALETGEFDYWFLAGDFPDTKNRLEGFLFPDTYECYVGDDPVLVIRRFLNNFESKFKDTMRTLIEEKGMSVHDVVTIASLIEREAKLAEEQETISGVIQNRLNSDEFPYLEIDAAIQYILPAPKANLSYEDLEIDDPYNTYKNRGLPPGPIANPGMAAILAAMNPEEHDYYFYVAKPDGSHIFSETLEEHNEARELVKTLPPVSEEDDDTYEDPEE